MAKSDWLARVGDLEVRLAVSPREIAAAQALRYRVFFEAGGASPEQASRHARRDICRFDEVCDHVIALDLAAAPDAEGEAPVVGAYRLLRQEVAAAHFGFYSAAEFEVDALVARHPQLRFMELGRSCVGQGHRSKRTIETLWRGVWAFALRHGVDVMFGCASLPGADTGAHAGALAALGAYAAEPEWSAAPATGARRAGGAAATPEPRALRELPPLLKGYLRLGARFGGAAVIDEAFNTTDVFVVLRVVDIESRYLDYFAPERPIAA